MDWSLAGAAALLGIGVVIGMAATMLAWVALIGKDLFSKDR